LTLRRTVLSMLARCTSHLFPRVMPASEALTKAWHMARVRIEAQRIDDERDRWDVERRRKRGAIGERLLQGYSRSRGRRLTVEELRGEERTTVRMFGAGARHRGTR
jgi:hypothetical protein